MYSGVLAVVVAVTVAWVLRRPIGSLGRQFFPNRVSERLRAAIVEGRQLPSAINHVVHSSWVDESGTSWSRESILGKTNHSTSQQRIPMLIAWPSKDFAVPSPVVFVLHGTSRAKSDPVVKERMARFTTKGAIVI